MLSKLRHVCPGTSVRDSIAGLSLEFELQENFGSALTDLCAFSGGTLNFCFVGTLNGERRFFKTHVLPEGRAVLAREIVFLRCTAEAQLNPLSLTFPADAPPRDWLHMKALKPSAALSPSHVRSLVASYDEMLCLCDEASQVSTKDHIGLLLFEAWQAMDQLVGAGLLSSSIRESICACLQRLDDQRDRWPLRLCHGDLGPANILAGTTGPVVVDWEDVFWGIEGYDYLYWLTFFDNRKWMSRSSLGHTPWGVTTEIDLMVMILLLKSMLSVRNGSYRNNTMSFDLRLLEVLALA